MSWRLKLEIMWLMNVVDEWICCITADNLGYSQVATSYTLQNKLQAVCFRAGQDRQRTESQFIIT